MSGITTHILDTSRGRPAGGVNVTLERLADNKWKSLGTAATNADGRIASFSPAAGILDSGAYRLRFDVAPYYRALGMESFYSEITIAFNVSNPTQHFHVPLLLSPYGYSTYRGSWSDATTRKRMD